MNLVAWAIVTCEVLFWVVILAGFTARYIFKRNTLGLILLALTPVLDIILLVISGVDLAGELPLRQRMRLRLCISQYPSCSAKA